MTLNVLVDGYNLELLQGTGIKTYAKTLLTALTELDYISSVLTSRVIEREEFCITGELINRHKCFRIANLLYKGLRIKTRLQIGESIDIWHATYPLPITIKGTAKITTIHDLIPLKLPHLTLDNKSFFRALIKESLKESKAIIAVSENTKKDILSLFDYPEERIFVTYQPITFKSIGKNDSLILERHGLQKKNYILFVGAIEPKKNIKKLIEAHQKLKLNLPLVIVGKKAWLWKEELKNIDNSSVLLLNYITGEDLQHLYSQASCFVFPSFYEGFGLPILEAMNFDCPVITSNISSMPEVAGNAALYIDPHDSDDIAAKINQLLSDQELQVRLIQEGRERIKTFSPENYKNKIEQIYQSVIL
jgi:glycosyltransferase involved in cell wall biosynthesis